MVQFSFFNIPKRRRIQKINMDQIERFDNEGALNILMGQSKAMFFVYRQNIVNEGINSYRTNLFFFVRVIMCCHIFTLSQNPLSALHKAVAPLERKVNARRGEDRSERLSLLSQSQRGIRYRLRAALFLYVS